MAENEYDQAATGADQVTDTQPADEAPGTVDPGVHLEAGQREGGTTTTTDEDLAGADVVTDTGTDQGTSVVSDQVPYGTPAP